MSAVFSFFPRTMRTRTSNEFGRMRTKCVRYCTWWLEKLFPRTVQETIAAAYSGTYSHGYMIFCI
jgi:hypothetical protein